MKIPVIEAGGKTGGSRFCKAAWRNLRDAASGRVAESPPPMISIQSIRGGQAVAQPKEEEHELKGEPR